MARQTVFTMEVMEEILRVLDSILGRDHGLRTEAVRGVEIEEQELTVIYFGAVSLKRVAMSVGQYGWMKLVPGHDDPPYVFVPVNSD